MKKSGAEKKPQPNDPRDAVRSLGLRYMTDAGPGFRRRRRGKNFTYLNLENAPVRDPEELQRIRALAIPPAWKDVWICPSPNGHLQATGIDARGRKQYRYHSRWRAFRDENKYDRLRNFGAALAQIRERTEQDLQLPTLCCNRILATVVRLLETTLIRIGNEEYARTNNSFGLTTLRNRHVTVSGEKIQFRFRGKSGVYHNIELQDRRLARIVKRCREIPGQELFQYLDDNREPQNIGSAEVNNYLKNITGEDFTARDFRTWWGTVLAATTLYEMNFSEHPAEAKQNVLRAIEQVAGRLGNTPSVCRKSYIHPLIPEMYLEGTLVAKLDNYLKNGRKKRGALLQAEEYAVLKLLQQQAAQK